MIPRSLFATVLLALSALAAPPLTTIQDVLYKADGTRFNGTLSISWTSFEAIDTSAVPSQFTSVTVMNGNLRVQLVPTTTAVPPASYSVKYNSDGRVQFVETWMVPSSVQPLRVRDVRVDSTSTALTSQGALTNLVQESDVVGLIADLGARPLKGAGYAPGRVAFVNSSGSMETVSGSPTDCVRVDGSSGACGQGGSTGSVGFVDGDSPSGIVDGSNTSFALSAVPDPASSLAMYRNGVLQKVTQDFTANGSQIQFVTAAAPQPGDTLLASYRLTGVGSSSLPAPEILCSGTGAATTAATFSSLAACSIAASVLAPGDRVEVRFDFEHQGTSSAFSIEIHWGATTVLHRDAAASDVLVAGHADAAIVAAGAQLSSQSWGTVMAFNAGVAKSTDAYAAGITIDLQGMLAQAGETLTLRNYTVVRFP